MDYQTLLTHRRSVRKFTDEAIPEATIHEMLKETCLAPSACNYQPWRFIVVQDQAMIKRISDESKKNIVAEIEADPNSAYARFETILRNPDYNVFYNAPALVLVVGEDNYPWFMQDCSLAIAYFMFAATSRNLGTCWIGFGERILDSELKKELGLPENYKIVAPIIVGHPEKISTHYQRNEPIILNQ